MMGYTEQDIDKMKDTCHFLKLHLLQKAPGYSSKEQLESARAYYVESLQEIANFLDGLLVEGRI